MAAVRDLSKSNEMFNDKRIFLFQEYADFKLLSLNVRGIRSAKKGKAIFMCLNERKYDIIFLQGPGEHNGKVSFFLHTALIIAVE